MGPDRKKLVLGAVALVSSVGFVACGEGQAKTPTSAPTASETPLLDPQLKRDIKANCVPGIDAPSLSLDDLLTVKADKSNYVNFFSDAKFKFRETTKVLDLNVDSKNYLKLCEIDKNEGKVRVGVNLEARSADGQVTVLDSYGNLVDFLTDNGKKPLTASAARALVFVNSTTSSYVQIEVEGAKPPDNDSTAYIRVERRAGSECEQAIEAIDRLTGAIRDLGSDRANLLNGTCIVRQITTSTPGPSFTPNQ